MLSKCLKCDFNVRKLDEFCLNCGLNEPTVDFDYEPQKNIKIIYLLKKLSVRIIFGCILSFIIFCLITGFDFNSFPYLRNEIVLFGIIVGFSLSFMLSRFFVNALRVKRKPKLISTNSLMSQAKKLNKRTGDLRKRLSQIQRIQDRIGVADTETLLNLSRTLIEARKPIEFQLERYLLQRKKLELIRIQNRIQPYLENFNELNEYKMEDGIVTIQNGTKELFGIGHHLAGNFTPEIEPERQHFLEQLKETQNVCEKLREVLLSKQAIRALKDISPIDEINTLPQTFDLSHASETFNIQATLTAFSDSFEQLESEYRRIIDESEVSQKLIGSEF